MNLKLNPKLKPLWTTSKRYTVLFGGRGSGKSYAMIDWSIAQAINAQHIFLAARQFQRDLSESIHTLLVERIHAHGLVNQFHITDRRITHKVTGSYWIYRGLERHVGGLQSIQGITAVLVEEGQYVTDRGWQVLRPGIRRENSRIIVCMNPRLVDDPLYRDLIEGDDFEPDTERIHLNWEDNPHWNSALETERTLAKRGDPELYEHIWGGNLLTNSAAQVYHKGRHWFIENEPEDMPATAATIYGMDIGLSAAPSAVLRLRHWVNSDGERRVHIEDEKYGGGTKKRLTQQTMPIWLESVYKPGTERKVRADHQVLATGGLRRATEWEVVHAAKGPGSVDAGVRWLQGARTTIDPRCKECVREWTLYRYETDPLTEEVRIDKPPAKKHDHCPDAARYAMEPFMIGTRKHPKPKGVGAY